MPFDKIDLLLAAINDVKSSVIAMSAVVSSVEMQTNFTGKQVAQHDTKIERLIADLREMTNQHQRDYTELSGRLNSLIEKKIKNNHEYKEPGRLLRWVFVAATHLRDFWEVYAGAGAVAGAAWRIMVAMRGSHLWKI